jgi:hypothetical protein
MRIGYSLVGNGVHVFCRRENDMGKVGAIKASQQESERRHRGMGRMLGEFRVKRKISEGKNK